MTATTADLTPRQHSRLTAPLAVAITVALVLVGTWLLHKKAPASPAGTQAVVQANTVIGVGKQAPDFTATTVGGAKVSLSQYRGHPVWLNFNATWCADCRTETPDIEAAYRAAKGNGLVVVSIYLSDTAQTVKDYTSRVPASYVQIPDPQGTISEGYRVAGVPTQVFVDADGTVRSVVAGALSRGEMDSQIKALQAASRG